MLTVFYVFTACITLAQLDTEAIYVNRRVSRVQCRLIDSNRLQTRYLSYKPIKAFLRRFQISKHLIGHGQNHLNVTDSCLGKFPEIMIIL